MIDLLIIAMLLFGVLVGLKRGFIMQLFHLASFVVSFIVAAIYYDQLAPKLELWIPYPDISSDSAWSDIFGAVPLDQVFYNAIAFAILFFATKIILHIIGSMLDFIADLPILRSVNKLLGGVLGCVEIYLLVFVILYLSVLLPITPVQEALDRSILAAWIVEHTPYISGEIKDLWLNHVANKLPTELMG